MKIEYARSIPLRKILFKLGFEPISTHDGILHYRSPFSNEKFAYLRVDTANNTWLDIDLNIGGDTIDFVAYHLKHNRLNHTEDDCLRWVKNMMCGITKIDLTQFPNYLEADKRYEVRGVLPVTNFLLLRYLDNRHIDRCIAREYVREIRVVDTEEKKVFRAIGLQNEDGGYAIRNSFRKAHILPTTITFIRGEIPKPDEIQVFKDVFDFMAMLTVQRRRQFKGDTIILNSYSCLNDVMPYIANYGYKLVKTWLPNDTFGVLATNRLAAQFALEQELVHEPMNKLYEPYVSPNEWLIVSDKRIG